MFDAPDDDAEEGSAVGVTEVVEITVVEFTSDVAKAPVAVVEDKCPAVRTHLLRREEALVRNMEDGDLAVAIAHCRSTRRNPP